MVSGLRERRKFTTLLLSKKELSLGKAQEIVDEVPTSADAQKVVGLGYPTGLYSWRVREEKTRRGRADKRIGSCLLNFFWNFLFFVLSFYRGSEGVDCQPKNAGTMSANGGIIERRRERKG